jgi:succinate dehydrogenase/fumarate reductase flavoprotein subunit
LLTLLEAGVEIRLDHEVTGLCVVNDRVEGVEVRNAGLSAKLRAERGVVLAAGGFSHSNPWKARLFRHVARGQQHVSLPPVSNTGDSIGIAQAAGAGSLRNPAQPAAWTPVSNVPVGQGRTAPWPHFGDKGKPGVIAVNRQGLRFVNEADSYHAFVLGLLAASDAGRAPEAWLIADHRALRAYGLGAVRPHPWPIWQQLRSGYLLKGKTMAELAGRIGLDADALESTVAEFNRHAAEGRDPLFGRGESLFNRRSGDAAWSPNPAVAPLVDAPFYALRVLPADIGTFAGLPTDEHARVLDATGVPMHGLYAVGNDAVTLFGGDYPAAGITLGPALTFGHIAARHALGAGWPANTGQSLS